MLTVDQASHLATSVFQTLMEQAEQGVAKVSHPAKMFQRPGLTAIEQITPTLRNKPNNLIGRQHSTRLEEHKRDVPKATRHKVKGGTN